MDNMVTEALQELFVALTARWRRPDGRLGIGVPRDRLRELSGATADVMDTLMEKLRQQIMPLGLELLEFYFEGQTWYAIRSSYACPNELSSKEEATLAVVIALCQQESRPLQAEIPLTQLKKRLVAGQYLTQYQLDRVLANLEFLGYLHRRRRGVRLSIRTVLEFSDEAREHIAQQAQRLVY